ncbi:MAG: lipopolysaccharide biosynthesis protein [Coleofasciculus sp. A1-SPW-01]|uniref:lipopolysaccharide biosynthesis protein n=1 Tax=Coleofasciculus sp. A1-SPW-01 TaxID=3070819 RepID=UPI0032F73DA1
MSIKQKAIKSVVWSAIQNWGTQAISLVVFFVLARVLQPEDFGLVALANVFLAFMQIFLEQGFAQALVQREPLEPEHLDTAFWTNLGIGVILTVLGVISASFVADRFSEPELTPILKCFSLLFIISALSKVQQAILERNFAFKAIAARWLLGTIIGGCVGVTMAVNGFGVWSLVAQQIFHEFVGTVVLWLSSDWRPKFRFSNSHFQQLFGFGINILGFNFLNFFNNRINDFLIGYFISPVALGYYTIAYRVLRVMTQLLVKTTKDVSFPTFSRLQSDIERFQKAFYQATQLTSLVAFPCFLGMATLAPELVQLLFGEQWLPAIPLMQILAFMGILRSVSFFKSSVFLAMGKPSWWFWLSILNAVSNFVAFAIAIPWGMMAVVSAYVIRGYLVFPVGQWAVSLLIKTPLLTYLGQFVAPLVSSLIMAIAILGTKQLLIPQLTPFLIIVVCSILGIIVYGTGIRLFAPQLFNQLLELTHLALSKPPQTKN